MKSISATTGGINNVTNVIMILSRCSPMVILITILVCQSLTLMHVTSASPPDWITIKDINQLLRHQLNGHVDTNELEQELRNSGAVLDDGGVTLKDPLYSVQSKRASEDFTVTSYQRSKLIPCGKEGPCKAAHEKSFRCKCSNVQSTCWAPGKFSDAECKFFSPGFGVKFYQP